MMHSESIVLEVDEGDEKVVSPDTGTKWKSLSRLSNYGVVSSLCGKAKGYYDYAKNTSVLKGPLETAEFGLKKLADPLMVKLNEYQPQIDGITCKGLDTIEAKVDAVKTKIENGKKAVELVKVTVDNKVVKPAETAFTYSKETVNDIWNSKWNLETLGNGIDKVLTVTEDIVSLYVEGEEKGVEMESVVEGEKTEVLPPEETKEQNKGKRTTRVKNLGIKVSKELQRHACKKLYNLKLRSTDRLKTITHIDLIQYAREHLDAGTEKIQTQYTKAKKKIEAVSAPVIEKKQKLQKEMKKVSSQAKEVAAEVAISIQQAIFLLENKFPTVSTSIRSVKDKTLSASHKILSYESHLVNETISLLNQAKTLFSTKVDTAIHYVSDVKAVSQLVHSLHEVMNKCVAVLSLKNKDEKTNYVVEEAKDEEGHKAEPEEDTLESREEVTSESEHPEDEVLEHNNDAEEVSEIEEDENDGLTTCFQ